MQTEITKSARRSGKPFSEQQRIPLTAEMKTFIDSASDAAGIPVSEIFRRGALMWITQNVESKNAKKLSQQ